MARIKGSVRGSTLAKGNKRIVKASVEVHRQSRIRYLTNSVLSALELELGRIHDGVLRGGVLSDKDWRKLRDAAEMLPRLGREERAQDFADKEFGEMTDDELIEALGKVLPEEELKKLLGKE